MWRTDCDWLQALKANEPCSSAAAACRPVGPEQADIDLQRAIYSERQINWASVRIELYVHHQSGEKRCGKTTSGSRARRQNRRDSGEKPSGGALQ